MTPAEQFEHNLPLIERVIAFVARRWHVPPSERDDFASYARVRLIEDDYRSLRRFGDRSSLQTYLVVVVKRTLFDYRIVQWGKWRPSTAAKRLGPQAVELDRLLTRDFLSLEDAIGQIQSKSAEPMSRDRLEQLAAQLPARPARRIEDDSALEHVVDQAPGPEAIFVRTTRAGVRARAAKALALALTRLSPKDRLLVRLRYVSGLTMPRIATMLRVEARPLYRRLDKVHVLLRHDLEAQGITPAEIRELLADPEGSAPVVLRFGHQGGGGAARASH